MPVLVKRGLHFKPYSDAASKVTMVPYYATGDEMVGEVVLEVCIIHACWVIQIPQCSTGY